MRAAPRRSGFFFRNTKRKNILSPQLRGISSLARACYLPNSLTETMKHLITLVACVAVAANAGAQIDPTKARVVYLTAGMEKVKVEDRTYKTVNDTSLQVSLYYPPNYNKRTGSPLPVVIFVNGIGNFELPQWKVYQDWARLTAAQGMLAVNYQSRRNDVQKDLEDLVAYLQQHADIKADYNRIGLWACSANVGAGMPFAMKAGKHVRALVMYYGAGWTPEANRLLRQDLEILVVRAGLDFYDLNKNVEAFVTHALANDAHLEYINYPEGQHAFDVLDNTERSREIVKQTLAFLQRTLSAQHVQPEPFVLTNLVLWDMIRNQQKTDVALQELKKAFARYRAMPGHTPWYNHLIDERNLNQLGYALLKEQRTADAIKVFQANAEAFPDSPNAFDALADAYEQAGDKTMAVSHAKRALEKLDKATDLPAQWREAIRKSADDKLRRLQ